MMIRPRGQNSSALAPAPKCNILLDSGAYSAWRSGKPINLDKYCDYLLANQDWITHGVALDVINPGRPEEAARASFDNYEHMRKRGLDPIPVFHVGEDISWLYRMLDAGASYIGLSASSLVSRNQVDDWYALAWSHLVNRAGLPIVKAHAFGEGRLSSVKQFPWYSADSTSWIYAAQRTGQATLTTGKNVSMRNDGNGSKSSPDIGQLSEIESEVFQSLLREARIKPHAFDERNQTATVLRTYLTALYYMRIQKDMRALHPIRHHPRGFFTNGYSEKPKAGFDAFNMHLVCGNNDMAWAILAKLGHMNVLASYFYIESPLLVSKARGSYQFKSPREFVLDPIGMASTMEPYNHFWKILEEYIHD